MQFETEEYMTIERVNAKALPEKEWKRVENCHAAIISREDFEKVASMRKGNTCAGAERKHETHCLTGKMICGICGHRLSHSYSGRPKYYCAKHYLDKTDGKCNISVLDSTMEEVVLKSLQLFIDMWVDSRKIVDMQREKQKAAVSKMAQVDLPEVAGFEMLEGQMKLQKLNKEIVDAFVAEIVVHAKDRVEIKWKFRDEFLEAE